MKNIKRYLILYKVFIAQFFKKIMQSKVDFLMGLIGFLFTQVLGISFLYLVFQQIPMLNGWTLDQLIFIYGFAQIPRGIDHLLTDNIWSVAWWMVVNGEFDRYMLRPMNIFFQVIAEKLQPDAFGELLVGTVLVIMSIAKGIVIVDVIHIFMFFISVIVGTFIYTAIKLFYTTFSFYVKNGGPIVQVAYEMSDFAKYPTEIYPRVVRAIITWIIPFAFVAYLPASYFIKSGVSMSVIWIEGGIAIVFSIVAHLFFNHGTKIYESAGN